MITFFNKNKMAVAGGLALLLLIYVYLTYFSGGSSASLTASDSSSSLSSDILVTLQSIHSIKLDNAIFTDPVFTSLTDFGVTIPPENVGRRNPFLPLSGPAKSSPSSVTLPSVK